MDIIVLNNKYLRKFVNMDVRPVKIYAEHDVPRLRYIASLILGDILGLSWELTTDKRKLGKHPVINYSDDKIAGSFKISPSSLLFEKGIITQEIVTSEWKSLPVFFTSGTDSDLPFDIFAASFFLVTRYEEYLKYTPDEYGRFKASDSVAFRNGFLGIPIVDLWAKEMAKSMLKKLPMLAYRRNEFRTLVTIDSDEALMNSGNSILRSISGFFRDKKAAGADRQTIKPKTNGTEKNPYDVYDYISEKLISSDTDALFFFPVGDNSEFDKNPSWKNNDYRMLIKNITGKFRTGLHPSYKAAMKSTLLISENERLNIITKKPVETSRFHYSRLFFPSSYRTLQSAGISEDYSMGYPDEPGFRAGIARPFQFYDVADDVHTRLMIFPFQVMDVTLFNYKKLDTVQAKEVFLKLISETKKAGGLFVSIWHNTSLLEGEEYSGKRDLFELIVKKKAQ
jgi:hypothetical protein